MSKKSTGLTFSIGDLLGRGHTPPCLLKEPCDSCGKEEANHTTYDVDGGRNLSGHFEQIRVCKGCLGRFEPVGVDEMDD